MSIKCLQFLGKDIITQFKLIILLLCFYLLIGVFSFNCFGLFFLVIIGNKVEPVNPPYSERSGLESIFLSYC